MVDRSGRIFAEPADGLVSRDDRDGVRQLAQLASHDGVQAIADDVYVSTGGWVSADAAELSLEGLLNLEDQDLDELCLVVAGDTQHATSTCRMGPADDPNSVVDTSCQVHGFENLAVVDASVMPSVPSANTHLTTLMIAEKVADELL